MANKILKNPQTTRVNIKIQDGCNNRCSYCIIPYARGNSRSNTIENVIKQIAEILKEFNACSPAFLDKRFVYSDFKKHMKEKLKNRQEES